MADKTGKLWKNEDNIKRIKKLKLKPNQKLGGAIPKRKWSKIFGIGLPKTGNHTLDTLLRTNGLESMQSEIGTKKGNIAMNQIRNGDYDLEILKELDAMIDSISRLVFTELIYFYPDALFVYMIREREDWLDSASRHWDNTDNKRVRLSHNNGYIKTATYGVWKYNKLRFSNILDYHHWRVMNFFGMHESIKTAPFAIDYDKTIDYVAKKGYLVNKKKNLLVINFANGNDEKNVKILSKFTGIKMKQKKAPDVFRNGKIPRKETLKLA